MKKRHLAFTDRLKLKQLQHRKHAVRDSIIALALLSVPFFGHHLIFASDTPSNTRDDDVVYRMSMTGDIMLGRHVHDAAVQSREHVSRTFDYVRPFFDESDYVTGNFESPILDPDHERYDDPDHDDFETHKEASILPNKHITFFAEPWAIDALEYAGFDSVSLANNHTLDYGDLSFTDTLEHFNASDIDALGIGDAINIPEDEVEGGAVDAADVKYVDLPGGVRMAIAAYTEIKVEGFDAREYVGGVLTHENIEVLRDRMIEAKLPESEGGGGADIMVVHVHWGQEYQVGYNDDQEEKAQYLANFGADLVIGHHSHVLEPITVVEGLEGNQTLVMNSLGNFVFDQGWSRTKETALAQLDFLENGSKELSFVPMYISDTKPAETSGPLKAYRDFRIFRTLNKELDPSIWEKRDGRLVIDLDEAGIMEGVDVTP
ncbi:CapA family protein [Salisediminibacterium selenitireducens]|uniref:Capsule synthesis protein, CapA n=1 Tax=Bacillus selenitireducens (strain ATCC 700615 / DSM 15326 / MLS10) TaxID=439292 RepID=D6XZK8_BACIE|nr:CapA family protein [Salisediminibacterium selenitireducens]ADH98382.1 Capsule synthesis protein, CapA [[Bacillus] selenitireducens MLS10]